MSALLVLTIYHSALWEEEVKKDSCLIFYFFWPQKKNLISCLFIHLIWIKTCTKKEKINQDSFELISFFQPLCYYNTIQWYYKSMFDRYHLGIYLNSYIQISVHFWAPKCIHIIHILTN